MSKPAADPAALFARLPPATRDRLQAIGREAHDPVGDPRDHQAIFDRHVGFLDALGAAGLKHEKLAAVLAAVGIHREDGTPLPRGTVSSALCRARLRATAAPLGTGGEAAAAATPLQPAADSVSLLQRPAADGSPPQQSAARGTTQAPSSRHASAAGSKPAPTTQPRKRTSATPSDNTAAAAAKRRRAATLLNQLRSKP